MLKSKKMTVAKIAKIVARDISVLVQQATASAMHAMPDYKTKYEDLVAELQRINKDSTDLYKELKAKGLTYNTLEAEGCVRAMTMVMDAIQEVEDQSK